jgi:predicted N-acetyltransferase YhbS
VITFEPFAHYPQHIDELSQWMFQKWGQFYPGSSVETTRRWLAMTMRNTGLPITQLALDGETLVGCVMLQRQELYKEKDLTPWLGALLVEEKYQNQGIGSRLHGWGMAHIKSLDYKKLHLLAFDPNHCEWYHRKGWTIIKSDDTRGHPLIVMEISLPQG